MNLKKIGKSLKNSLPELPEEKSETEAPEKEAKEIAIKKEVVKIEPPKVHVSREEDQLTREIMEIQRKLKSL